MKFRPNADIIASVFVHLLLLGLIFVYSEVHQFDPVAADTVPVEVVTPQEVAELPPEPTPTPSPTPEFRLPSLDKTTEQAAPEPAAQAPQKQTPPQQQPQQKQAATPAPKPSSSPAPSPTPNPPQQQAAAAPPPAASPAPQSSTQPQPPVYKPPEPDVSVKYGVMLGLPPDLSVQAPRGAAPSANDAGKDSFDAAATEKADIGTGVVAEFRRHLKTCMKLPAQLGAGDDVRVKLRVFMKPDGKLAAAPQLIEASASEKGPLLLQSATSALQACQPYAMLPKDRYGEWKVLDLDFSPRDFAS